MEDSKLDDSKEKFDCFLSDFNNLFVELINSINKDNSKFLKSSIIENFKSNYLNFEFNKFLTENTKEKLGMILLKNYFLFQKEENIDSFLILLIDIISIIFSIYSHNDFYYSEKFSENEKTESVYNKILQMEKYFIFTGNDIPSKDSNKIKYELIFEPEFIKIDEALKEISDQKTVSNDFNKILDLILLSIIRESDIKYLSINVQQFDSLLGKNPVLSFKIIIFNILIHINLPNNKKSFSCSLGNSIKFILSEANSLSMRMNQLLYDDKFNDFDYKLDTVAKKLNFEEMNFLRVNFFPLLNLVFKVYSIDKNFIEKKGYWSIIKFYFDLLKNENSFIKENSGYLHLIDFDDTKVTERISKRLENIIEEGNKEKVQMSENEIQIEKYFDEKIDYSYSLLAFIYDTIEFVYSKFHIMPESFADNTNLKVDVDPFVAYEERFQPLYFNRFLRLCVSYSRKSISNISNFVSFSIFHNDFKNKNQEKIQKLTEESEDIYNLFQPFNLLGFNILFWISWKDSFYSKISNEYDISIPSKELILGYENRKFIHLSLSKLKMFDTILPVSAYLLKCSQNFKYMAFEMIFEYLDILEFNSINDLRSLRNYSYDDIFKDFLEFIGGPDPQLKRQKVASEFNKLLLILSDEVKKKLILFVLKENLQPNKFINDQLNAFILHSLRTLMNNIIKKKLEKESGLFEEEFLKKIISLSVTTKVFVIDIFEVICQGENFIQFCILLDKRYFGGNLNIYNKEYLNLLEKENEKVLFFISKWNRSDDEEKMKQVTIDTSEMRTVTDAANKRKELMEDFDRRKNQGLITQGLISHLNDFIFKCKKELSS